MLLLALSATAMIAGTVACGRTQPAEWTTTIQAIQSPSGANASEPQLSASPQGPILSWIERMGTTNYLKFAERTASGWTTPVTAASGDGWFLSYADVPSVMRMSDGTLVSQVLFTTDEGAEGYDLLLSYSKDGGKTWAPSFTPHHDGTKYQHGFASLVELANKQLGVVWLDGRNSEVKDDDLINSGTMLLRYAAFDSNWKQVADAEIDHRVCECCSTSAVVTADGVLTAFRDRSNEEIRDIAVSRLNGSSWSPSAPISKDNWMVDFCPVNGPMLSARGRDVAAAWFTVKNDQGQAYAAFSGDAGATWTAPVRLDEAGSLGRVDVELLDDGSAVASWVEYANGQSDFRMRRIDKTGAKSKAIPVAGVSGGQASGFPRIARRGNELLFAWTDSADSENGGLVVKTAVAALP